MGAQNMWILSCASRRLGTKLYLIQPKFRVSYLPGSHDLSLRISSRHILRSRKYSFQ
jgi:hypothetical protein